MLVQCTYKMIFPALCTYNAMGETCIMGAITRKNEDKMSTLTIRILEKQKQNLDDAASRLGFHRMKQGEVKGDITALLTQIAQVLPDKSPEEIRAFLLTSNRVI